MKPKAKYDWEAKRWDLPTELIEAELGLKGLAGLEATIREAIPRDEPVSAPFVFRPAIVGGDGAAAYNHLLAGLGNQSGLMPDSLQAALNMQGVGAAFQSVYGPSYGNGLGSGFGALGLGGIFGQ